MVCSTGFRYPGRLTQLEQMDGPQQPHQTGHASHTLRAGEVILVVVVWATVYAKVCDVHLAGVKDKSLLTATSPQVCDTGHVLSCWR